MALSRPVLLVHLILQHSPDGRCATRQSMNLQLSQGQTKHRRTPVLPRTERFLYGDCCEQDRLFAGF